MARRMATGEKKMKPKNGGEVDSRLNHEGEVARNRDFVKMKTTNTTKHEEQLEQHQQ